MQIGGVRMRRGDALSCNYNKDDIDACAKAIRKAFWSLPLDFVNMPEGSEREAEAWKHLARAALGSVRVRVEG